MVPTSLFEGPFAQSTNFGYPNYDVSADGQRFLMIQSAATEEPTKLTIVVNWLTGLQRLDD